MLPFRLMGCFDPVSLLPLRAAIFCTGVFELKTKVNAAEKFSQPNPRSPPLRGGWSMLNPSIGFARVKSGGPLLWSKP